MTYKKRMYLEDAIQEQIRELTKTARECADPLCQQLFVYGREGSIFCSTICARRVAQRRYRKNLKRRD